MARVIVYNVDWNAGLDKRPQKGDVVEVLPDGVHPGTSVLGNPQFLVIDVPGDVLDYADLVESDRDALGNLLRYRTRSLDVTKLAIVDAQGINALPQSVVREQLVDKPAFVDPMVIG